MEQKLVSDVDTNSFSDIFQAFSFLEHYITKDASTVMCVSIPGVIAKNLDAFRM